MATTTTTTATASNVASRLLQHQQSLLNSNSSSSSALQHLLQTPSTPLPDRPFILVPLYIYPTQEAWQPLYRAAEAHPTLDFYVVVNPGNGPGEGALPDANYIEALARLTALRNVWVIGYVHCSYGKRPAEDVVRDVEGYARWESEAARLDGKVCFFFCLSSFPILICWYPLLHSSVLNIVYSLPICPEFG